MGEKIRFLNPQQAVARQATPSPAQAVNRRIALITDGEGLHAPLDYAIDACARQGASIDLLVHDCHDIGKLAALEARVRKAGLECRVIRLEGAAQDAIINYIISHQSLIFLVAMPDDVVARALIEEVIPQRGGRIPVPLVLIEDRAAT